MKYARCRECGETIRKEVGLWQHHITFDANFPPPDHEAIPDEDTALDGEIYVSDDLTLYTSGEIFLWSEGECKGISLLVSEIPNLIISLQETYDKKHIES